MIDPAVTRESPLVRYTPAIAIGVLLLGATVVAMRFGAPAVVLWFAFAALAGGILLFWESLRAVLDPNAPGDEIAVEGRDRNPSDLEDRKQAALQALRDIEFEHSIRRISDQDYAALKEQYRAEARAAMEAMDKGLGPYLARAEELMARAGGATVEATEGANRRKKGKAKSAAETAVASAVAVPSDAVVMPRVSSATEASSESGEEPAAVASAAVVERASEPGDGDDADVAPVASAATDSRACTSCETRNDLDATFCKRCGTRMAGAA